MRRKKFFDFFEVFSFFFCGTLEEVGGGRKKKLYSLSLSLYSLSLSHTHTHKTKTTTNTNSYSLSLWYGGGVAVASGRRSGGDVVNALFAAMSAGLALSQAVPAGQALALGRAAAGRLLGVIDR